MNQVTFDTQLGNLKQKVQRIEPLAKWINGIWKVNSSEIISKIVCGCKADLVSQVVIEFPELARCYGQVLCSK